MTGRVKPDRANQLFLTIVLLFVLVIVGMVVAGIVSIIINEEWFTAAWLTGIATVLGLVWAIAGWMETRGHG